MYITHLGFTSVYSLQVCQDIWKDLKAAKYFTLEVDDSRDCEKDEQIYVCEGVLNEDFFNFVPAEDLDANSIMNMLKEHLALMGVYVRDLLIAECYDGVSAMSGRLGSLQALTRREVPYGPICTLLGTQAKFSPASFLP